MAVNKRKVLEAARKFAQKGAKEKALKEYHTLLKLDPRDAKLHLEIGDAHRRWGQVDEAVGEYTRVAEQYQQEGFDARAVAVFKQILNLDPKRYATYVSLSELYQHMGLDAEAVGALQTAADGYHKEGRRREALELLRKMAALDPTNTTSRMKVADLLRQEGLELDAVTEYEGAAEELLRTGSIDTVAAVYERILEIQPERVDVLVATARNLIELRNPERAEPFARRALSQAPDAPEHYDLLCDVYKALGRVEELADTTRSLAKLYRERGEESQAREVIQRLPAGESIGFDDEPEIELDTPETGSVADEELLDDEEFFESGDTSVGLGLDQPAKPGGLEAEAEADAPVAEELPEGDPDQLLAEASVYLRYGKTRQATASLRAILGVDPEHRPALEKLGEAYAAAGEAENAVESWSRAARVAREAGEGDAVAVLRDRIASLDEAAAAALSLPEVPSSGPSSPLLSNSEDNEDSDGGRDFDAGELDELAGEMDLDIELDPSGLGSEARGLGDAAHEAVGLDSEAGEFEVDVDVGFDEDPIDFEIEIDAADGLDASAEPLLPESPAQAEADAFEDTADAFEGFDVELDAHDLDSGLEAAAAPERAADGPAADGPAADGPAAAGDDPSETFGASQSLSATTSQQIEEDLEEGDFYFQQGLHAEAETIYRRIQSLLPQHPTALLRMAELARLRGDVPATAALRSGAGEPEDEGVVVGGSSFEVSVDAVESEAASSGEAQAAAESAEDQTLPMGRTPEVDDDSFDLAAELRDALDDDESSGERRGELSGAATADVAFESIFDDFKRGVSETLSDGDYETRYDLAIAYREMELYGDAISEFARCLESPARRIDSLHMMGSCALELDRGHDAVNHLEQALALPDLPEERQAGIQFDLGRAFAHLGDVARARRAYQAVIEIDAEYPEAVERLAALPREVADRGESFEDLVAEAESAASSEELFESFDDLLAEDLAELAPASARGDPSQAASSEAEDAAPGDSVSGRRKKISFV